ncbi:MAG TPA: hypothetical protein VJ955_04765 [Desulfuromonadales bacterium]|nr:hypothetical protein [Desulfuromonadales bacterium]
MNIGSAGSVAATAMQSVKANVGQEIVSKTLEKGQAAQTQQQQQTFRQPSPGQNVQQAAPAQAVLSAGKGQNINIRV